MPLFADEKHVKDVQEPSPAASIRAGFATPIVPGADEFEVFKKTEDGVDFRTVSWPRAAIIFLKGTSTDGIGWPEQPM